MLTDTYLDIDNHASYTNQTKRSFLRFIFEIGFYVLVFISTFPALSPFFHMHGAVGAAFLVMGTTGLFFCFIERVKIPKTLYFIILFNLSANLSLFLKGGHTLVIGEALAPLMQWGIYFISIYYIIKSSSGEKRVILFFALLMIFAVAQFGFDHGLIKSGDHKGERVAGRLVLEGTSGIIANSNGLAYMSGIFAVALLYWAVKIKRGLGLLLWPLSIILAINIFRTISRGGIIVMGFGLAVFVISVLASKGTKFKNLIILFLLSIAVFVAAGSLARQIYHFQDRMHDKSNRTSVYTMSLIGDLAETLIIGKGPEEAFVSGTGIQPHNSFLQVYMAFGGITGLIFCCWVLYLFNRARLIFFNPNIPREVRFKTMTFLGMMTGCMLLTNFGYGFTSSVFVTAVIENIYETYKDSYMNPDISVNPQAMG
jgi:hypothetical protein